MNKWMFTFCKYNCHSFTLCLPYAKLTSYSTGCMQISNDAKLNMTDGTSYSLGIRLARNEWVKEWTLLRTTRCMRGPWWSGLTPPVKPQRVCCKLGETIQQPCSDVVAHSPEVCKGARLSNGYLASKDDQDSWGTCTTSAECKTVITVVLTVMSYMDPHMISENLGWVLG
jgi:hypothetical protein